MSTRLAADSFFRRALESSPDGILILDLGGIVQFVNPNAAAMLGAGESAALLGAPWQTLCAEPDRLAAQAAVDAAACGETRRFPASGQMAAGRLRRLDHIVSPLHDDAGALVALLVTSRDVTDLEAARLAAEASARVAAHEASVQRSVAEMAYLTSWDLDFRSNVSRVGAAGVQAMRGGPEHSEITMEQGLAMYAPEDRARILGLLDRARLYGEPFRFDAPITRHDGTLGWVRQFGEPIYEDGVCVGIRGAGMDVTDEMTAQERIRSAQQRLNLAVQLAGLEVYEYDFDQQSLIHEGASTSTFDSPTGFESLFMPDLANPVASQDRARVRAEWVKAQETHSPFRSEFRVCRPDGQEVWVYGVAEIVEEEGRPRRLVAAIMDITERKRSELEMLQTLAQMREHEERQKLLLDELNHRVKNTLVAVQSVAVQTLASTRDPQEGRDLFIERLLALSNTHNLLVKSAWTSASFRQLVETALKPYGQAYHYEGQDLHLDPNFAVSLGMALHELATNALKHGAWRAGGQVDITTVVTGGEVRITWRESSGPPASTPARRGFGSRLLERGVAAELGGKVVLTFAPEGLVCRIQAPTSARMMVVHESLEPRQPV
ncbi:PAS domain S-box protein [Phenylobacterium sp. LjRoot225]|uniref:sensor histidine kinase n=1 Tax=Phenylobacterium sp. LjRoot225 TaxID=3342285 RepID=UPI003ECFDCC7